MIKILALALTLSQLFTRPPEQFQTHFNPVSDQKTIETLLHDGCVFASKQFGAENVDVDSLLDLVVSNAKAMKDQMAAQKDDPSTPAPAKTITQKLLEKVDFDALSRVYKKYCKGENVDTSDLKLDQVVQLYNETMKDLPDPNKLKNYHLPEATTILDHAGQRFSEIYTDDNRRHLVPIAELPAYVKLAFVAAEDKRFFKHPGIDITGIVRAMPNALMSSGHPQGGSTITQQVVKNLLVGDDVSLERKMREMVLATKIEKVLTKDQILELYINSIYLGRTSWGIEMAARSYFGKPARKLSLSEAAFLAGLTRGPNYYDPDKHADRAEQRRLYVLGRLKEDGYIKPADYDQAVKEKIKPVPFESPRARSAYYFLDEIQRQARKMAGIKSLTSGSYVIRSTIDTGLQKVVETALQDGLADYEQHANRAKFVGPVGSIAKDLEKYDATWQDLLPRAHSKFYDVHWPMAVVLDASNPRKVMVGLDDGRVAQLSVNTNDARLLQKWDLIHVDIHEPTKKNKNLTASLKIPPRVQGGALVLEAKTGRILAMTGGFSYAASQLNRVTQTARQPGSTLKPFIYSSALNLGYQPNTLILDAPIVLPPIYKGGKRWAPHDYDGKARGLVTIRQAVENSLNLPTARIVATMAQTPTEGLDYIRGVLQEFGIYKDPIRYYPFILGAQNTRLIDLATAYATIANISQPPQPGCPNCLKPVPHVFDSIEQNGHLIYERPRFNLQPIRSVDRVSIYQVRRIIEGTVERGTAVAMKDLGGFVAGKTGTSNNNKDAWFVGFTNDIVVAVWVGYDSEKIERSLGATFTGGRAALPIASEILRKSFEIYKPKEPLSGIPEDIRSQVAEYPIDYRSGEFNAGNFTEIFRLKNGSPLDTRFALVRNNEVAMGLEPDLMAGSDVRSPMFFDPQDQVGPDQEVLQDPGYQNYQPGVDNDYEYWQRENRFVDPMFYGSRNGWQN